MDLIKSQTIISSRNSLDSIRYLSLYKEIIPDGFWKVIHNPNITSDIKRDKVLTWFITQYKWFKKRIDKIYYDYLNQQNNFKQ